jgi:hypothetical protein
MSLGDEINSMLEDFQSSLIEAITTYQTTYIDTATTNNSTFSDSIAKE